MTYVVVAGAAAAAVYFAPQAPAARPVTDLAVNDAATEVALPVTAPVAPAWRERVDTLGRGETLVSVLQRAGVSRVLAAQALRAAGEATSLRAGIKVTTVARAGDSLPQEITYKPAVDRVVRLRYLAGAWQRMEEKLAWRTDTLVARGAIRSSLHDALHAALGDRLPSAERSEIVWKLADIFEYRVDMDRDLQPGDSVRLLLERKVDPEGKPTEAHILAASMTVSGKEVDAIRFERRGGSTTFFDQYGKSLRAAFLRAPVEFRRISSVFGMRNHPILGEWKMHKGTDYAAAAGTPVRAIGEGTVAYAGWKSGFGNVIEVRHSNGYVSRYGHLRGFAKGVRRGSFVAIGKTIGYVGMTGLATAPHLHFEMLVDGVQRDPRKALRDKIADPIPARERGAFAALRSRLFAALDLRAPSATTRVADAN
ncbi:Peptidase M23 [Gemmatirosa kalamazoonensis]|uniref:Peptidase M23 n=1 Tax=Gemmatirosa kalamazoonensis TaxID=861299 RepID=W0RME8_9BACT|nr:M23 family metallopeptidase [Gemmatirosa kalamazoonensis]AHG90618.1 Peptidase M23 [Gemmatirosa kalamazoonensis]